MIFDASRTVNVKAPTADDAAERALDLAEGSQHLCHQCSSELETGDSVGCHVYRGDKLALDTTRAGELQGEADALKKENKALNDEIVRLKTQVNLFCKDAYPEVN